MAGTSRQIAIRIGILAPGLMPTGATEADHAHAARYSRAGRREQSLLAHALLRDALFEACGTEGALWRIGRAPDGRPTAVAPDGRPGPDVSLAHSGSYGVAALVTAGRIGVDIETPRPGRDWRATAEAYLSKPELTLVESGGQSGFLALWTLREAVAKAAGGGMAQALSLDGAPLAAAVGGAATIVVDGIPCVVAQRACGSAQLAVAWIGGTTEAAAATALDAACASIQSAT